MIRRFWGFTPVVLKKCEPPEIPDDKDQILEILRKRFEVLSRHSVTKIGTTVENGVILRCPFCKSEFTGMESSGCFHHYIIPLDCPVCNFPYNLHKKLEELLRKNEETKK